MYDACPGVAFLASCSSHWSQSRGYRGVGSRYRGWVADIDTVAAPSRICDSLKRPGWRSVFPEALAEIARGALKKKTPTEVWAGTFGGWGEFPAQKDIFSFSRSLAPTSCERPPTRSGRQKTEIGNNGAFLLLKGRLKKKTKKQGGVGRLFLRGIAFFWPIL
jgi:hypothetical protein